MTEPFLSRWSRRKRQAEVAEPEPAADMIAAPPPDPPTDQAVPPSAPPDLPPIDSLTRESDYRPFLAANVPEALHRAALRALWRSDPLLANLDGLNDYDGDFTIAGSAAPPVRTVWRIGREVAEAVREADKSLTPSEDQDLPQPSLPPPSE